MKKVHREKNKQLRLFEGRISTVVTSVVLVVMIATLVVLVWQKSTNPSTVGDYEGRIVDRWADYVESEQGSKPRLRLVVEIREGKRITVAVEPAVYESARIGMGIRSRNGQIVLIESDRNTGGK